ncbi:aquaporin family protein [Corynebacterium poyangense]|uniref:Aquaporin family protein n=1 Tax=Corynebacterium poyangense TaxID=2684405 RepID=A0A7H0SRR5_9CORY|nr:MIP/aquaporin family protein [Corynebacterium poyangense]MBZ8176674.1 aquaporin family protein [Corynebacterium poyangense]QNQ91240.1 aquaporin family protein [Corynebacterium poyangense]
MTGLQAFGWEFLGTAVLLLLGNGVCALNSLRTSAARGTGWVLITLGWGMGVFVGASIADPSGGHLNPAVTLMLAIKGATSWALVPWYIAGQLAGAFCGAILVWAAFKQMFDANNLDEQGNVTGANHSTNTIFFTAPAHPKNGWNAVTEFIGTTVLLLFIAFGPVLKQGDSLGPLSYFGVAFVVVAIGMSLGTPTGYAINPVRDLGPRLAYSFILPIRDKGPSNWSYAWVPIVGPLLSAVFVGLLAVAL